MLTMMTFEDKLKILAASLMLLAGLGGGWSPQCLLTRIPSEWIAVSDAMSGGVLLSVAFCHMLSESAHSLDDWGIRARASMGACSLDEDGELDAQCEPFPAGLALALLGLLVTVAISGGRPHDHKSQDDAFAPLPLTGSPTQAGLSPVVLGAADDAAEDEAEDDGERGSMVVSKAAPSAAQSKPAQTEPGIDAILLEVLQPVLGPLVSECGVSSTAGFGTLVAMSVHSTIEGLAVGASSTAELGFFVLLHKYCASFVVGSGLRLQEAKCRKRCIMAFALSGPASVLLGMLYVSLLPGPTAGALSCFAAGTLIAIALTDMLLPSLQRHPERSLMMVSASAVGAGCMTLLAVWA